MSSRQKLKTQSVPALADPMKQSPVKGLAATALARRASIRGASGTPRMSMTTRVRDSSKMFAVLVDLFQEKQSRSHQSLEHVAE